MVASAQIVRNVLTQLRNAHIVRNVLIARKKDSELVDKRPRREERPPYAGQTLRSVLTIVL